VATPKIFILRPMYQIVLFFTPRPRSFRPINDKSKKFVLNMYFPLGCLGLLVGPLYLGVKIQPPWGDIKSFPDPNEVTRRRVVAP
jgi:hypothetical protein